MDKHNIVIYCKHCNTELGKPDFKIYSRLFMGYTVEGKLKAFCNWGCYKNYWDNYLVEEYHGSKIYKITVDNITGYVPYKGCSYYFTTLDDCKIRIDLKNVAVVNLNMFRLIR